MSYVFLSYSRQELTFTDSLTRHLIRLQMDVWVDFRRLVPGHPWQKQIDEAIDGANALLLVVSKASMDSEAVRQEWERAYARNCRIILLIFEAVSLPEALQQCEWVDFRERFSTAMRQLKALLSSPVQSPATPAPQSGFRMPPVPTLFYYLTWVTALMSLVFVVPAIRLVRLPRQVRRRSYQLNMCRLYLGVLATLWFIVLAFLYPGLPDFVHLGLFCLGCLPLLLLLLLQYSEAMYRWGGPGGTPSVSGTANVSIVLRASTYIVAIVIVYVAVVHTQTLWPCLGILIPLWFIRRAVYRRWWETIANPQPVRYQIQAANPDRNIEDEIVMWLDRAGHKRVTPLKSVTKTSKVEVADDADYLFILLSSYSTQSQLNLYKTTAHIYPVIIEDVDAAFNTHDLGQLQWIDLRRDAPNRIPLIGRLIDQPDKLMDYLGVLPSRHIKRPWTVELAHASLVVLIIGNLLNVLLNVLGGIVVVITPLRDEPTAGTILGTLIISCSVSGFVLYSANLLRDHLYSRNYPYTYFMRDFIGLIMMSMIIHRLIAGGIVAITAGAVTFMMMIVVILNRKVLRLWLWPGT